METIVTLLVVGVVVAALSLAYRKGRSSAAKDRLKDIGTGRSRDRKDHDD